MFAGIAGAIAFCFFVVAMVQTALPSSGGRGCSSGKTKPVS